MMSASDATKQLKPEDLANQLFDAVSQYQKDPREVARLVIVFLKEALIYAITATAGDEGARKGLLKSVGESIALMATPPTTEKP